MGAGGIENFVLTPLEDVRPSEADRKEARWMRKWGLGGPRNRAVPALHPRKWGFLQQRKMWKAEIKAQGGRLLKMAVTVASKSAPLSPQQLPPPLMLTLLAATRSA